PLLSITLSLPRPPMRRSSERDSPRRLQFNRTPRPPRPTLVPYTPLFRSPLTRTTRAHRVSRVYRPKWISLPTHHFRLPRRAYCPLAAPPSETQSRGQIETPRR